MARQNFDEGDMVCTVGRDGSKMARNGFSVPVWAGVIYIAKRRKRDGKITWRRHSAFGGSRAGQRVSKSFLTELKAQAEHPWCDGAKHGVEVPCLENALLECAEFAK